MNIFDCNTHIEKEPLSIRLRELNKRVEEFDEGTLTHYATVQDILSGIRHHNIQKSLVMPNSITTAKEDALKASEMISQEIEGYNNLTGLALVHPYSRTSVYDLEEGIQDHGLKGLMLSPDRQGFELSDEALWILLERVEEMELTVFLYTLWSKEIETYLDLKSLYDIATSFHLNFILAHMGSGRDLSPLSDIVDLENVYLETSHTQPKALLRAIDMFGSEKLVFGSDFSYNLYPKYELEKILSLEINKKDQEKILGKNLEKLLK
jgi:predicted TIM-barrel fold metal-dependent hydrolase